MICLSVPFSALATETETEPEATVEHGGSSGTWGDKEYQDGVLGWFEKLVDNVIDLPKSIWQYISDGLISLFVPTDEQIVEIKDKWDSLLRKQFGGLYEAVDLIADYAAEFKVSEKKTIDFPVVSIPVGSGVYFDFGGWTVQIVPDGFDTLFEALKLVISVICTVAFVNMLRTRLENILEAEGE